jgi:hypothetical protein
MAGASDFPGNRGKILFEETQTILEKPQRHAQCEKAVNAGDPLRLTEMIPAWTRVCAAVMVRCMINTNMMAKVWTLSSMDGTKKILMVDA